MNNKGFWLAIVLVLWLGVGLQAQPEEAKAAAGLTLYQLPLSSAFAATNETELLRPATAFELTGLAGEVILVRLGVTPPPATGNLETSLSFPGGEPAWAQSIFFLPEQATETKPMLALWLTLAVRTEAEPGTYKGNLTVRAAGRQVQVPFAVTVSAGRLGPSTPQYLLLSASPRRNGPEKVAPPPGVPSVWPAAPEVAFLSLEEQNGDVGLDLSGLNAAAEHLTPPFTAGQPLPIFVGPLMNRLSQQFGIKPRSATYVLACHSLLCQLRDWAKGKGGRLIFVPPAGEGGAPPQAPTLDQDLLILRETPEVSVLLPAEPLLSLGPPDQQRLLSLAQGYLAQTRQGVLVGARPKGGNFPLWLQVDRGDRLRAGFWAEAVGASVVLVTAEGRQEDCLWTLASRTDARYLATLRALLARAQAGGDAAAKRFARQAQAEVEQLSRDVEQAAANPAGSAPGDAELDRWRDDLRHLIVRLTELLP